MVKRRIKNISLAIIFGIFFISFVSAWNFPSSSTTSGTTTTVINNFTINGSTAIHNELDGLQGGIAGEYYHIKADWYNTLNSNINDWITESVSSLTHYYTDTEVDAINDSMKNYVDSVASGAYDDTWINDTIDNKISDNNDSVNNYIADNNASVNNYIADNNNSVNAYILYVNSTNGAGSGSYDDTWINDTIDSKILVQNNSLVNYIGVTNGTLYEILMNGSFFNAEATDTFVANYSTFLTHITYADVMNGTLEDYFDGIYQPLGNYLTEEALWNANYSQFLLNNVSITNALATKLDISQWNATNISYMTGDNFTLQNISMKNYIATVNTSQTNLNTLNNVSLKNWISNTFNATRNNYVAEVNLSMKNYVIGENASQTNYINSNNGSVTNAINAKLSLTGGNMAGNLNLSANINLTMNGGNQVGSNVTCVIIKGSTTTLNIC